MDCAGVVLTGGASRRMGCDKASLPDPVSARPLGARTAELLALVASPVLELGPGRSGLPARSDGGRGPLVALAAAADVWDGLALGGWVIVVATDLPRLNVGLLRWLAQHPAPRAVVPLDRGRLQPLCARYPVAALRATSAIVSGGERRLQAWVDGLEIHAAAPEEWLPSAGDPLVLRDADTPFELRALQSAPAPSADSTVSGR